MTSDRLGTRRPETDYFRNSSFDQSLQVGAVMPLPYGLGQTGQIPDTAGRTRKQRGGLRQDFSSPRRQLNFAPALEFSRQNSLIVLSINARLLVLLGPVSTLLAVSSMACSGHLHGCWKSETIVDNDADERQHAQVCCLPRVCSNNHEVKCLMNRLSMCMMAMGAMMVVIARLRHELSASSSICIGTPEVRIHSIANLQSGDWEASAFATISILISHSMTLWNGSD